MDTAVSEALDYDYERRCAYSCDSNGTIKQIEPIVFYVPVKGVRPPKFSRHGGKKYSKTSEI